MMQIYEILNLARARNNNENVNKIILANLLKQDLAWVYANLKTTKYDQKFLDQYLNLIQQYVAGMPLGYILGHVFFHGQKILVDHNVLIPRDETEGLVDLSLSYADKFFKSQTLAVLDLCTGSGCIAISLAKAKPKWNLIASDISAKALKVARANQQLHQVENLVFVASDLFANLDKKFNLIICNPPYIDQTSDSYQSKNLSHEPALALFADNSGLDYYQRIFSTILHYVQEEFLLAFEIGFDQKDVLEAMVQEQFQDYSYWFEQDYNHHWRFLFISSRPL